MFGGNFWHPCGASANACGSEAFPHPPRNRTRYVVQNRTSSTFPPAPWRVTLANMAGIVFESALEIFDMTRVYAFWFHFYGFPQPLAEGLS